MAYSIYVLNVYNTYIDSVILRTGFWLRVPHLKLGRHKSLVLGQECHKHVVKLVCTTLGVREAWGTVLPNLKRGPNAPYGTFATLLSRHQGLVPA